MFTTQKSIASLLLWSAVSLVGFSACGSTPQGEPAAEPSGEPEEDTPDASVSVDCGIAGIVRFTTSDGVELVADYIPPPGLGKGAVVLFHMIPPSNDRTGYPPRVRDAFAAEGFAVLNVDRRGAGESGGVATEAYQGLTARLDVEAAVTFLLDEQRGCPSSSEKIMLVGASNGTTAVMDYTTNRSDTSLPAPAALAWLSPGSYTEGQNAVLDHDVLMKSLPVLIVHPANETWSNAYINFSESWKVVTLQNGGHGTQNFDDGAHEAVQLFELVQWAKANIAD